MLARRQASQPKGCGLSTGPLGPTRLLVQQFDEVLWEDLERGGRYSEFGPVLGMVNTEVYTHLPFLRIDVVRIVTAIT